LKPITQTLTGEEGNCFAACIASLLEVKLGEIDLIMGGDWYNRFNAWLAPRGLAYFEIYFTEPLPPSVFGAIAADQLWVAVGPTPRGLLHAVVMRGETLAHDPHPSAVGLSAIHGAGFLVPLDPSTSASWSSGWEGGWQMAVRTCAREVSRLGLTNLADHLLRSLR